jgi:hypothetical protein
MEAALGYRVNVNMYHTPGGEQAFDLHYDETEVFVLQLRGRKIWTVYEPVNLSHLLSSLPAVIRFSHNGNTALPMPGFGCTGCADQPQRGPTSGRQ